MKKLLAILLTLVMVICFAACGEKAETETTAAPEATSSDVAAPENQVIRLATTTSVNDSGLLGYLLPKFEAETGYKVEVASAGTGIAIGYAKSGDADLLLVHSKAQEEAFIEEGYASTERLSFMYNYFVIVGPADDPAGIAGKESAADCFKAISEAGSAFASRGDNSGTHNKETGIWEAAGIDPAGQAWYNSLGSGMGDTLIKANELGAYALTDKATFLSMKDSLTNLSIIKAEAEDMKNTYSLIGVNPAAQAFTNTDVALNTEGAQALIDWLLGDEAAAMISEYGISEYGEQLFYLIEG
ncbi:MAG: substrate-binding domain-containing protein [Clostridia bacterium]|nr:substrate-binding domain-containing protein [Clostridia bacterium]